MTEIISHRGGALLWPENSLEALRNSVRLGVEQVQIDIHLSRDGKVVVIHDGTMERTTEGSGRVDSYDWAHLSNIALKNAGGQRILSLDDAIAAIAESGIILRIEIKRDANGHPYPDLPASLAASLERGGMQHRVILTSSSVDAVTAAAALTPSARVGLLTNPAALQGNGLAGLIETAKAHGIESLGLKWDVLSPEVVSHVGGAGLKASAFACNDQTSIDRALSLGVDELMTDRPDLALERRGQIQMADRGNATLNR